MTKNIYFPYKTIKDVPLHGKTVLVRADYNVPLADDGKIDSDYRMTQSLPTLQYLLKQNCKIVICSHLGRPKSKQDLKFSLKPIAKHLSKLLDKPVIFSPTCTGDAAYQSVKKANSGDIVMLENLRFHEQEEANDKNFAKQLKQASQANYFVQDGFGVVHRAHASTSAITMQLPSVAGLLLEKEVTTITKAMSNPAKPFIAVLGGAKISDKIDLVEKFIKIADTILIGGAMANTFLQYYGLPVGKSLWEDGQQAEIQKIAELVQEKEGKNHENCGHNGPKPCLLCSDIFKLPVDVAVGKQISAHARRIELPASDVAEDDSILDIGGQTIQNFVAELKTANTIIWNGTMGYAELQQFALGSSEVAEALRKNQAAEVIIGGGDTADYVLKWNSGKTAGFDHISTGGGASLELMTGLALPGVKALMEK